jgi:hypothetical protein
MAMVTPSSSSSMITRPKSRPGRVMWKAHRVIGAGAVARESTTQLSAGERRWRYSETPYELPYKRSYERRVHPFDDEEQQLLVTPITSGYYHGHKYRSSDNENKVVTISWNEVESADHRFDDANNGIHQADANTNECMTCQRRLIMVLLTSRHLQKLRDLILDCPHGLDLNYSWPISRRSHRTIPVHVTPLQMALSLDSRNTIQLFLDLGAIPSHTISCWRRSQPNCTDEQQRHQIWQWYRALCSESSSIMTHLLRTQGRPVHIFPDDHNISVDDTCDPFEIGRTSIGKSAPLWWPLDHYSPSHDHTQIMLKWHHELVQHLNGTSLINLPRVIIYHLIVGYLCPLSLTSSSY